MAEHQQITRPLVPEPLVGFMVDFQVFTPSTRPTPVIRRLKGTVTNQRPFRRVDVSLVAPGGQAAFARSAARRAVPAMSFMLDR